MNTRSAMPEPQGSAPAAPPAAPAAPAASSTRLLPWLVLAIAMAAGVALAFRYGSRVTPLIDGLR